MLGLAQFRRNLALHDLAAHGDPRAAFEPEPAPHAGDRIFVLVPHCDDETLGVGGLIHHAHRAGAAVEIAFTTNGDGSRSTQLAENARRLRHNSFLDLAAMRQREAQLACAALGVPADAVHFLGFPDRGTGQMWLNFWHERYHSPFTRVSAAPYPNATTPRAPYSGVQLLHDVRELMTRFAPTRVFTTHPNDTHPDHWASWAFALAALESLKLDVQNAWAQQCTLRAFMVHRGVWPAPHGYQPDASLAPPADLLAPGTRRWTSWELDAEAREAKKNALAQHDSQMTFTPHYLRGFLRRNELFEHIETAGEQADGVLSPRGVSLIATSATHVTLRVHMRHAAAPRGTCTLDLRALSTAGARAWTVELHGRERSAPGRNESFIARATEQGGDGETQSWRALRSAVESDAAGKKSRQSAARKAIGTSFDLEVPREALGTSDEICLVLSATSRLGKTVLEHTEIGAVRLHEFSGAPLLVARSDPRYGQRELHRYARQEAKQLRKSGKRGQGNP